MRRKRGYPSAAAGFQQRGKPIIGSEEKPSCALSLVLADSIVAATVASACHACQFCICACKILPTFLHTSDAVKLICWYMLLLLFLTVRRDLYNLRLPSTSIEHGLARSLSYCSWSHWGGGDLNRIYWCFFVYFAFFSCVFCLICCCHCEH